jgi:hypothetical protein
MDLILQSAILVRISTCTAATLIVLLAAHHSIGSLDQCSSAFTIDFHGDLLFAFAFAFAIQIHFRGCTQLQCTQI